MISIDFAEISDILFFKKNLLMGEGGAVATFLSIVDLH